MKLSIKTSKLQEMVARAIKGASNNKMIPITQMIAVELKKHNLTLITTDATNTTYIKESKVEGDDFYVTVQVDTFSKLIARTTSENISLELKENYLEVVGNGTYSIELPVDEEGKLIKYPDPLSSFRGKKETEINLSTINVILNTVKYAISANVDDPCYTGYYVGDSVVGTDTYKIASMDVKLFNVARLISPEMMNLLSIMTAEKIEVKAQDNVLVFNTPDCVVYGTIMDGIEEYSIDAINELVNTDFKSSCKISKSALLQVLDRLSLFVGAYDKNGIYLTFTKKGLQISSKASNGVELISYVESSKFKDFTCCIDIEMFTSQIKAQAADVVELHYGVDNAIKMIDGNITQIVSLLEDDRVAE